MALPCVLVDRFVCFNGEEPTSGKGKEAAAIGGSRRELSPLEAMAAMKPNLVIMAPPEVTRLFMLRRTPADQLGRRVHGGEISSTHKGLVVLYTGSYRPGIGCFAGDGCYLIYDAANNAVSTIPPLPDSPGMKGLGRTAVVLRQGTGGDYSLAELVTTFNPGLPEAELFVWSRSSTVSTGGQWIKTPVRLPLPADLCGAKHFFQIDMAFSLSSSVICWVDLLAGVLVCDLLAPEQPKFSFIPLPMGSQLYASSNDRLRYIPEEFRSMGCVRGAIKFVSIEGYSSNHMFNEEVTLKTWTLSPDFKAWKEGKSWSVGEIVASKSFKKMELPHVTPTCPVLSMNEDEVIYVMLNDLELVKRIECGVVVGMNVVLKAHYRIEFDMLQNKVLKSSKTSTHNLALLMPTLLASDFSAHLQGPRTAREEEESEVGADTKRMKY